MASSEARYYRILELPVASALTEAQLRQAYHRRALQLHPDRHLREGGASSSTAAAAAEGFKELQVAYEYLLKKVQQQQQLDQYRKKRQSAGAGGGGPMDDIHSLFDMYRRGPNGQAKHSGATKQTKYTTTTTRMTEEELFKDTVPGGWVYREGSSRAGPRRGPGAGTTASSQHHQQQQRHSAGGGGGRNQEAEARWRQAHGARVPERAYSGPVYDDAFYRKYAHAEGDAAAEPHTPPSYTYADKYKERVQRGSREYEAAPGGAAAAGQRHANSPTPAEEDEEKEREPPPFMDTAATIDKINSLPDGDDRRAALQKEWAKLRANIEKKMHEQEDHAPPAAPTGTSPDPPIGVQAPAARRTSADRGEADKSCTGKARRPQAKPPPPPPTPSTPPADARHAMSDEEWLRRRTERVQQQMEAERPDTKGEDHTCRPPPPPPAAAAAATGDGVQGGGGRNGTLPPHEADARAAAAAREQDELLHERRQLYRYSLAEQYLPPPESLQHRSDGELAVLSLLLAEWSGRVEAMLGGRLRSGVRRCACCGRRRQQRAEKAGAARTAHLTSPLSSSTEEEDEEALEVFECAHSLCVCLVCAQLAQCCPLCGAPRLSDNSDISDNGNSDKV